MSKEFEADKGQIVHGMCMTYRHDYPLMEGSPAQALSISMAQIYDHNVAPELQAAFTAGRALGRREMKGDVKAWLITGSRIYQDSVAISEGWADFRIKERDDGASYKVPLYAIEAVPEEVGEEFGKPGQVGGCEWVIGWNNEATVTGCGNEFYDWHGNTDFKFCSYCSKTIRVSGGITLYI